MSNENPTDNQNPPEPVLAHNQDAGDGNESDGNESDVSDFENFTRRKKDKRSSKDCTCSDIGKNIMGLSDREWAKRNLQNLIFHRKDNQKCMKYAEGISFKKCGCVAEFSASLKTEYRDVHNKDNKAMIKKWVPRLLPFCGAIKQINRDPTNIETLFHLLEIAHPFSKEDTGNAVPQFVVDFGDTESPWFCFSAVWEFGGHKEGKKQPRSFLRYFLHTHGIGKEKPNLQGYFRYVIFPNANRRVLFQFAIQHCIGLGKIIAFDLKDDGIKKSQLLELICTDVKLHNKEKAIPEENKASASKWWNPVKTWIAQWKADDFLVVAHPRAVLREPNCNCDTGTDQS